MAARSAAAPVPLWRGRLLALVGIVLVACSLRVAVAALSPLLTLIGQDFAVPASVVGLIGTAPPICYAVFGILTPAIERRIGLESLMTIALVAITIGTVVRALASDATALLLGTIIIFAGVGVGNVLLPPLIKKYFPDRIGLMTTLYASLMAITTTIPALAGVPLATGTSWRFSLGVWAFISVVATIPWIALFVRAAAEKKAADVIAPPDTNAMSRLMRIPLVWALVAVFGTSSAMAYTAFGWLPQILIDQAGTTPETAGALLAVFSVIGLPSGLLVPLLVTRYHATRWVFLVAVVGGAIGLLGLVLAPASMPLVWVLLYGLTGLLFPMSLTLIGIRSRGVDTSVPLSGVVQSVGYLYSAMWPLLFGVLHETTGSWSLPLVLLTVTLVLCVPAGLAVSRSCTVEEAWEKRHGAW